jgi:hypothetical protein
MMVFVVISPFCISNVTDLDFSLLILVRFARDLSIFFIFSQNQLFVSFILCVVFFFWFFFIDFGPYVHYFFPSACFGICLFMFF